MLTVLPVSTPCQYFPAGWPDTSRPRAAIITGMGDGPNTYHITAFPDADRDVSEGKKMPIITRRNIPAYPVLPFAGNWPPHDFLVPAQQLAPVEPLIFSTPQGIATFPTATPSPVTTAPTGAGESAPAPSDTTPAGDEPTPHSDTDPPAEPVFDHQGAALRAFRDYPTLVRGTEGLNIKPRMLADRFQVVSAKGIVLFETHVDAANPEDFKYTLHAFDQAGKVAKVLGPAADPEEVHALAVAAVKICRAGHKAKDKKAMIAAVDEVLRR